MDWDELPGLFPGCGRPDRWLPLLRRHAALIEEASPRVRVTSVPAGEAVRRHYAESLELWRLATAGGPPAVVVDVGSGGGFPGIVIAAVAPGSRVYLVEPLRKRAALLAEMAEVLGLANIEVIAGRAEDAGRGPLRDSADLVTARAVADLPELIEYLAPFARPGATLAMPKGSRSAEELAAAANALHELACGVLAVVPMRPAVSETLSVVVVEKLGPTPERYPRRAGVPGKRPL